MPQIFRFLKVLGLVVAGLLATLLLTITAADWPAAPAPRPAEWAADSASVRVVPGAQYARGGLWQALFGRHYRAWWAAPATVPVLRLATAVPGGLVPVQSGGSNQSHTLRLCATNGRQYVLRSVDKDLSAALPDGWKRNLLRGLLKDQTSATQPYGAYPAARLAEAAGVLHANPRLVFVGNDAGLGKFRAEFGNALYLFEERPDGDQTPVASFGHSPNVLNSAHMLAQLRERPTGYVLARDYLRARLLDMLLGDWSRREDQWRWASFPLPGRRAFRPVPRDRDQAFFLFDDGLITGLVSRFVPKYQTFRADVGPANVDGLTRTARNLDRTLLTGLDAAAFQQVADSLASALTDSVLVRAFATGPPETRAAIAARLLPMLQARRAQLPAVAGKYFKLLNEHAWVLGTDQAERFVLSPGGSGGLRVQMLARRPGRPDSLLLDRLFEPGLAASVQVFGLAGDDVFELRGNLPKTPVLELYPGHGRNQLLIASGTSAPSLTWYYDPASPTPRPAAGINCQPALRPVLTGSARGWLSQYNLAD
ncbi:MAG: hypothetical protein M3Y54_16140 [Bacteroidota bacterium]|nr:hypothetical protein [Bacteroidota bacterium]